MSAKSLLTSKTFWVAILQGILGVVVVIGTQAPTIGWVVIAKSILDIAIRMVTEQPVTL